MSREDLLLYGKTMSNKLGYVAGQIEVTTDCYQQCRYCSSWRDHQTGTIRGAFTLQQAQSLLIDLSNGFPKFEHLTLTGGDPFAWQPLPEFLEFAHTAAPQIALQISTALARDLDDNLKEICRTVVRDFRVSIDGFDNAYRLIRGSSMNNLNTILERLVDLRHPRLSIICTLYQENIEEIREVLQILNQQYWNYLQTRGACGLLIRRIILMVGITKTVQEDGIWWNKWDTLKEWVGEKIRIVPTNFTESIAEIRCFLNGPQSQAIPCWSSVIGFHIKANQEVYPCCLVGGEAIETRKEFCLGNLQENSIVSIWKRHVKHIEKEGFYYRDHPICQQICQYKQCMLNIHGQQASEVTLAIP